jgi:hypothetical protein
MKTSKIHEPTIEDAVIDVTPDMKLLEEDAEELGSKDGMLGLPPENSIRNLNARLRVVSEKRHGPARLPDKTFAGHEARLRKAFEETEAGREALRARVSARTSPRAISISPARVRWMPATINTLALAALIALGLDGAGWRGDLRLGLGAALLLVNLPVLPDLACGCLTWTGHGLRRLSDWFARRRFNTKSERFDQQIAELRDRQEDEAARRHLAERRAEAWLALRQELILSHYFLYRGWAEKAANKDRPTDGPFNTELAVGDLNGLPARAPQTVKRRDYAADEAA